MKVKLDRILKEAVGFKEPSKYLHGDGGKSQNTSVRIVGVLVKIGTGNFLSTNKKRHCSSQFTDV
jgi:hypothetical protein